MQICFNRSDLVDVGWELIDSSILDGFVVARFLGSSMVTRDLGERLVIDAPASTFTENNYLSGLLNVWQRTNTPYLVLYNGN